MCVVIDMALCGTYCKHSALFGALGSGIGGMFSLVTFCYLVSVGVQSCLD